MIIYQSTKENFIKDVLTTHIERIILDFLKQKTGKSVGKPEQDSWRKSMTFMRDVLGDPEIPYDAGVTIEYQIPQTSKRIDFILTGQDDNQTDFAVLIELKQWSQVSMTDKDGIVMTNFYGEVSHPSYQAWSYAALLQGFNETVQDENIQLRPCAFLHNYIADDVIKNVFYKEYLDKAPVFLEGDAEKEKLKLFIKQFVKKGDHSKIMYRIDGGKIKPSKSLADSMEKMLKGNKEFVLIDDQKVVYENALSLARHSSPVNKKVLIVEGGPGTGKSVVAINLLVKTTKLGLLAQYVTRNSAPRNVYASKLTGSFRKTEISNFFSSSGAFIDVETNTFDLLIVDEAHRLNEKSGIYKNLGQNQIKELIEASKCTIFFIDEDQKVTLSDIGEKEEIMNWAKSSGAEVTTMTLASQFRCNGSDGYLAWLDNVLQIHETANTKLENKAYDFKIVDNPNELRKLIFDKNKINNKARLVAGYCWDWKSKKDTRLYDIVMPEFNFSMRWNLSTDGMLWIMAPESVNEIGCIHTCQGLEVDYVGVIVGNDLVVRNGRVITDASKRSKNDSSVKGYKKLIKEKPEEGLALLDKIIKNTYRTLMTRGMKGCYVYFVDKETEEYFKRFITK